jgi:hypothetical protein
LTQRRKVDLPEPEGPTIGTSIRTTGRLKDFSGYWDFYLDEAAAEEKAAEEL